MTTTELLAELNQRDITLSLPPDTAMPVPAGQWQRQDGRILATYTPAQLDLAMELALEWKLADLEARLEYYLDVLAAATGCDGAQAERLLAYWQALDAEYTATVTALAAVNQSVNSGNPVLDGRTATITALAPVETHARRKNLS
jgi:hypothetical protein